MRTLLLVLFALAPIPSRAGVVYDAVWYPDGVVRYLDTDVANFAPGALIAVAEHFRTHTPIDVREAAGEPNLRLTAFDGFGLAMTPGYLDPAWPVALRQLLFQSVGVQDADTIAHELMHALGFAHEHQRPDRDRWVDVCFNLDPFNYGLVGPAPYKVTSPYDFESIMHYEVECVRPLQRARMTPTYRGRPTILSVHDVNSLYRAYPVSLPAIPTDAPRARADFDDDGFEDVAAVTFDTHEGRRRVWLSFERGVATDPSEGLAPVIHVPWFRELVTTGAAAARLEARDVNGDDIPDVHIKVGEQRWLVVVNAPGDGWAPWGRKGARAVLRQT